MATYLEAWKVFRRLSDENVATARHLLSRSRWPHRDEIELCDVGCGDGRLAETLILSSQTSIASVVLVDPDESLLDEARTCVCATSSSRRVLTVADTAERAFPECARRADASLLVHVVYLIPNGGLKGLIEASPIGMPLYVVLDAPGSVFSRLWQKTAPKYFARADRARRLIESLPADRFAVDRSTFSSAIPDPFKLNRADLRDAVLSLMCYTTVNESTDRTLHRWIGEVVSEHAAGVSVVCDSVCYEVVRL